MAGGDQERSGNRDHETRSEHHRSPRSRSAAASDAGTRVRLRKLFDDKKVAEVVFQVTQAAYFDRMTEAAGLRLED